MRNVAPKILGEHANVEIVTSIEMPARTKMKATPGCPDLTHRPERIKLGLSIGHGDGSAGSIGGIVDTPDGDGVLSAAHVIALAGAADIDDWVYQPGKPDVRPLSATDRIGRLRNFTVFARDSTNEMDAAYALLENDVEHDANVIPCGLGCPGEGRSISGFARLEDLRLGMKIGKIGRSSCYTEGRLAAVGVLRNSIRTSTHGNLAFGNIIEVTWGSRRKPFTEPGDSGSLYFVVDTLEAVALHVAAGQRLGRSGVSYGCELLPMLDHFGIKLIGVPRRMGKVAA